MPLISTTRMRTAAKGGRVSLKVLRTRLFVRAIVVHISMDEPHGRSLAPEGFQGTCRLLRGRAGTAEPRRWEWS